MESQSCKRKKLCYLISCLKPDLRVNLDQNPDRCSKVIAEDTFVGYL